MAEIGTVLSPGAATAAVRIPLRCKPVLARTPTYRAPARLKVHIPSACNAQWIVLHLNYPRPVDKGARTHKSSVPGKNRTRTARKNSSRKPFSWAHPPEDPATPHEGQIRFRWYQATVVAVPDYLVVATTSEAIKGSDASMASKRTSGNPSQTRAGHRCPLLVRAHPCPDAGRNMTLSPMPRSFASRRNASSNSPSQRSGGWLLGTPSQQAALPEAGR